MQAKEICRQLKVQKFMKFTSQKENIEQVMIIQSICLSTFYFKIANFIKN